MSKIIKWISACPKEQELTFIPEDLYRGVIVRCLEIDIGIFDITGYLLYLDPNAYNVPSLEIVGRLNPATLAHSSVVWELF